MTAKLSSFLVLTLGLLLGPTMGTAQQAPSSPQASGLGTSASWYQLQKVRGYSLPARITMVDKPSLQVESTYHAGRFGVGTDNRVLIEFQVSVEARRPSKPDKSQPRQTVRVEGFYEARGDTLVISTTSAGASGASPQAGLQGPRSQGGTHSVALPQGGKMYLRIPNPNGPRPLLFTFTPTTEGS